MIVSTKGRYALRVLVDLAQQGSGARVPLKDIAARQGISNLYLQQIAKRLVECGLLEGTSGKGGGYALTRDPAEYAIGEVLNATEGTLASVACLAPGAAPCDKAPVCKTLPMWKEYDELVRGFFSGKTIADLAG